MNQTHSPQVSQQMRKVEQMKEFFSKFSFGISRFVSTFKFMRLKKVHLKITKQKEVEDKAKALLSENRSYNKSELQAILHWKLRDACKNIKDKKVAELK